MVDFKPADIFFDETSVTIVGIDNREGQESKKNKTVADISKVIIEILMKKKFTEADYKKHNAAAWHEIKFNNVEELYHLINDSYTVNTKSLNKTLQLPSSFDIYTSDA